MSKNLPIWWPQHPPIYALEKSYLDNFKQGPFFTGEVIKRPDVPQEAWHDFLGFSVMSPIGVPAGPLLNANWVAFAAQMGFDVVTYKTIRSQPHPAHPLPNMIYVETQGMLTPDRYQETLVQAESPPQTMHDLAATNSFGIPSFDRDFLINDIARARASLSYGQVLIVSVVGSVRSGEDFYDDFVQAAHIALEGGAQVIEADLSCPNVSICEGSVFTNPEAVFEITKRLKQAIQTVPLILKVGVFKELSVLRQVMCAAAKAGAQAICGINTIRMPVITKKGEPALGKNRLLSGICGDPIRQAALDFITKAQLINQEHQLGLTVMGTGGVTAPEHFDQFFHAGADIAMSAVGMMWDPYLAMRYHLC